MPASWIQEFRFQMSVLGFTAFDDLFMSIRRLWCCKLQTCGSKQTAPRTLDPQNLPDLAALIFLLRALPALQLSVYRVWLLHAQDSGCFGEL